MTNATLEPTVGRSGGETVGRLDGRTVRRLNGSTVPLFHCPTVLLSNCTRRGFTLVEVLLATLILGIGLTVLLASLSTCLHTMRLARDYDQVQWVLGLGELTYPEKMGTSKDVKEDYTVKPDDDLLEGFTFERTVDEKTDEEAQKDKLYVVHTRVYWGDTGDGDRPCEELVRYVWQRN